MEAATQQLFTQQLQQRIASKSLSLPMLPQVTSQVLALVNDVDSDASALAKLIQSDQSLAGHVMRIANSAAYSPNATMTSLQQATARLGMQNMAEIAMAATMGPKMFTVPGFDQMVKDIWQSSLATAVWAREIARQTRRNVESTFLCGLLFQIGRPVVLQTVLEIAGKEHIEPERDLVEQLMIAFQSEVGESLALHWQLPSAVRHTIVGIATNTVDKSARDIVDIVRSARVFAAMTLNDKQYDADQLISDAAVKTVNLYAEDIDDLLAKAEQVHDTMSALSF